MIDQGTGADISKVRDNSAEKPDCCQSCRFETTEIKAYQYFALSEKGKRETHKWLCHFCANTFAGNAFEYPEFYPNGDLMQHICHVANLLLAKLAKKSES